MKKILITGMTSAQTRETTKDGTRTVAGILADHARARGLDVHVRPFEVSEINSLQAVSEYSEAIVGLAPIRGLTSAYMYGALAAIHLFEQTKRCTLYHQDVGGRKTLHDLNAVLSRPESLVDPFFHYKRGYLTARKDGVFPLLRDTLDRIADPLRSDSIPLEARTVEIPGHILEMLVLQT